MTFDLRTSPIVEYLDIAIQALANARRLVLEALPPDDEPDDLPELPSS
jgi:hypothetical protein